MAFPMRTRAGREVHPTEKMKALLQQKVSLTPEEMDEYQRSISLSILKTEMKIKQLEMQKLIEKGRELQSPRSNSSCSPVPLKCSTHVNPGNHTDGVNVPELQTIDINRSSELNGPNLSHMCNKTADLYLETDTMLSDELTRNKMLADQPMRNRTQPNPQMSNAMLFEQPIRNTMQPEQPIRNTMQPEQPTRNTMQPEQPIRNTMQPEQPTRNTMQPEQPTRITMQPEQPTRITMQPEQPTRITMQPEQPTRITMQPTRITMQPEQPTRITMQPEQQTTNTMPPEQNNSASENQMQNRPPANPDTNMPFPESVYNDPEINKPIGYQPDKETQILERLVTLLSNKNEKLPKIEPETFSGDMLHFPIWIKSFEALVEKYADTDEERLFYLNRYTAGDAKKAIHGFLCLDGPDTFHKAKAVLTQRYGNKYQIAENFKSKLANWPLIKYGEGKALLQLSDFLNHCNSAMSSISYLESLNNAEENKKILKKLPRNIVERWNRIVDRWLFGDDDFDEGSYPPFSEFCKFLTKEARVACGSGNVTTNTTTYNNARKPQSANVFAVNSKPPAQPTQVQPVVEEPSQTTTPKQPQRPYCCVCKNEHYVDNCEQFLKQNREERVATVKKFGLCFKCLRRGHRKSDCRRRGPNLFYKGLPDEPSSESTTHHADSFKVTTNNQTSDDRSLMHSMIVPVVVASDKEPDKLITTYALLDNQSNSCFITANLADQLRVSQNEINLKLTTLASQTTISSKVLNGLEVRGMCENKRIQLPAVYVKETFHIDKKLIPRKETVQRWSHLQQVSANMSEYMEDVEVGLLIGFNCTPALLPRQVIAGRDHEPYGVKTDLGWGVTGMMGNRNDESYRDPFVYSTITQEVSPSQLKEMFDQEFNEVKGGEVSLSFEDRRFLEKMKSEGKYTGERFQLPLPLKNDDLKMPNNRSQALKRLLGLKAKLIKNRQFSEDYKAFMTKLIDEGHAEPVRSNEQAKEGRIWYIPHHGIYNHRKPGKIRIVFDCSAQYQNVSLNEHLLQGPDQLNNLTGVLVRFRQGKVAVTCDIRQMFHQIKVIPEYRDFLRFLWFEDNDMEKPIREYRMTVHLFGATSSPGCAIYALKETADQFHNDRKDAAQFIKDNFYMDDGLLSSHSADVAIKTLNNSIKICEKGGFELHKVSSNCREVLEAVPVECRSQEMQSLDLTCNSNKLPNSRTLGVNWDLEEDVLKINVMTESEQKRITRRVILSNIASIFDPLGLVSPFTLTGRAVLQDLCQTGSGWDDDLQADTQNKWMAWKTDLKLLTELKIPRCYCPENAKKIELHHFSDASESAYGQCSYLRFEDENGEISTSLVMAKSRVAPAKRMTIPRLELVAATLSTKVSEFLNSQLTYSNVTNYFWSDSKVVLGYIANDSRRFHIFVANRVQQIRDVSDPSQWHYVQSGANPADLASRGMTAEAICNSKLWWHGPDFLLSNQPPVTADALKPPLEPNDPEVRKPQATVFSVHTDAHDEIENRILTCIERYSSWNRARRVIALCLKFITKLKEKNGSKERVQGEKHVSLTTDEIQTAEKVILKACQEQHFAKEKEALKNEEAEARKIQKVSSLYRLDPFLDEDGIIRVGGRVRRASIPFHEKHPAILPKKDKVTALIITHYHQISCHSSLNTTLAEIRANGYWITKARAAVGSIVWSCVPCRRIRAPLQGQKMSDLPEERVEPAPPFTYAGVDFFGPMYVKEKRSERKRWGVLFTCLSSRAIHLEVANTLSTDSFINALRRFVARRGPVRQLRCDRGTNFVGAKNELDAALAELNTTTVKDHLLQDQNCDWIEFKFNVPHASHMGGIWERMVKSVKTVLTTLMNQHGNRLDDELLVTLLTEVEAIVNSRPLTYIGDPESTPLSPAMILTLKSKTVYPPPGKFVQEDLYCRKRWRTVQHLANQFWIKWRSSVLPLMQQRSKWTNTVDELQVDDVVLMMDDAPRCKWPFALVTDTERSEDGLVRKVTVRSRNGSTYQRPIHKLVLLLRPG